MKLSEFKKQIRENIIEILSEGPMEDTAAKDAEKKAIEAKMKALLAQKASLSKPQADPPLEEGTSVTKDAIQKKYNEMFGKNPQTTFADVAKALNITDQEIAAALGMGLPMFEVEEGRQPDTGKMVSVADKEALEMFREKAKQKSDRIPKFGWLVKMVDMIIDAGNNGTTEKKLADDLKKAGQSAINPVIRKLLELGAVKRTGTAPSEPKVKEPKEKMFKPKSAALPKDDAPEDVKDTYYDVDADDIAPKAKVTPSIASKKEIDDLERGFYDDEDEEF